MVRKTIILSLLLLFAFPFEALAEPTERVRLALVIGHNEGAGHTTQLRFAEQDAGKIADLFVGLGRVATEDLVIMIAPDADAVRAALREVTARVARLKSARTELFIYYSGHADDSGLQLGESLLPMKELRKFLEESGADVTIAIIDACHSGAIVRDKGGKRVPILDLSLTGESNARGFAVITSSSADEKSQESDELRGSFFTHFLASGMRGDADTSGDGKVSLYELYGYAYDRTLERSYSAGGREQHPTFDYAVTGRGQIVMSYVETGKATLVLPAALEGNFLLYSPETDAVLAEVTKSAGATRVLAVPPGIFELFKRSDVSLHRSRITVKPGEEKELNAEDMEEVSRTYLIEKGAVPYVEMGAKGGYQFFWDQGMRERSLLPSVLGGAEVRVRNLLGKRITPFAEILIGGGVGSDRDGGGQPIAQNFSLLEAGAGVSFTLLDSPFLLELNPEVALMYVSRTVEVNAGPVDDNYLTVSPVGSVLVGKEIMRSVALAVQFKSGYFYFQEDGKEHHLGFSEVFLTALMRL